MKSLLLVSTSAILAILVSACAGTTESLPVPAPPVASVILLGKTVHFTAPDGAAVVANPGGYVVETGDRSLRLSIPDGESPLVVAASPGRHEEAIKSPTPLSFAEEGADDADIHHIILLFPDGTSLDAVGTYSGVSPRGLRDRLAQRPLVQKAIQAKEAVQARIHDRLFGAPPPFSMGPNAFNVAFNENAVGAAPANAYLLTYLATLSYPEYLGQLYGDPLQLKPNALHLHENPQAFVQEFATRTHHLFWNPALPQGPANVPPQYVWVWGSSRGLEGQDPEAMVISTTKAVFVVFRGTDRVAQGKKKFTFGAEWVDTNLRTKLVPPNEPPLVGLVHAGFWWSLTAPTNYYAPSENVIPTGLPSNTMFKESLLAVINAFGGSEKKVWLVGHSLGAAHAQVYAAYLAVVKGLSPQGVYAVAAPHVGDQAFVDQLDTMFPNQRIQRFDFVHDPVTKVPLPLHYARAKTRVYFDDVKTVEFNAPERSLAEKARLAALVATPLRIFAFQDFCYHYPQWYLNATYNQLDPATASRVPSPLPAPVMPTLVKQGNVYTWHCGPVQILRGNRHPGTVLGTALPGR